jgi:hypothetical protein
VILGMLLSPSEPQFSLLCERDNNQTFPVEFSSSIFFSGWGVVHTQGLVL